MVFDASLRCGGMQTFEFSVLNGDLGAADGAGFTFDSKLRRRPLWQMHAIFLNQRGYVCLRRGQSVSKLPVQLPRLTAGLRLSLSVDLDRSVARFEITALDGGMEGSADISFASLFENDVMAHGQLRSGFFCAIVTGSAMVELA